jgi:hypothetical protein
LFNIRPTDTPEKLEKSDLSLILNALNAFRNEIYLDEFADFVVFFASTGPKCSLGHQIAAVASQ